IEELAAVTFAIFRLQFAELLFIPGHAPKPPCFAAGDARDAPQIAICGFRRLDRRRHVPQALPFVGAY
ncbi:hypothetical protein, partial [Sinorhizobium sp. 6-117]|uniref:hypothetical protein n=1 Tax=Sinorhizobium sp. 6-117 TaxID=3049090 RepID=UPI0024C39A97